MNKEQKRREEFRKKKLDEKLAYTSENLHTTKYADVNVRSLFDSEKTLTESLDKKTESNNIAGFKRINCAVKGLLYRTNQEKIRAKKLKIGEELILVHEENNLYDKNAIQVLTIDGFMIGYIDSDYSNSVSTRINYDFEIISSVSKITDDELPFIYIDIYYRNK